MENNKSSFGAYVDNEGILSLLIYQDSNEDGNGKVAFYFRETDEYKVYDKADFTSFSSYFNSIKNKVFYIDSYKDPKTGEIHSFLNRSQIKMSSGYTKGEL